MRFGGRGRRLRGKHRRSCRTMRRRRAASVRFPGRGGFAFPCLGGLAEVSRCIAAEGSMPTTRRCPARRSGRRAPVPNPTSRIRFPRTKGRAGPAPSIPAAEADDPTHRIVGPGQLIVEQAVEEPVDLPHQTAGHVDRVRRREVSCSVRRPWRPSLRRWGPGRRSVWRRRGTWATG